MNEHLKVKTVLSSRLITNGKKTSEKIVVKTTVVNDKTSVAIYSVIR